jgi:WD40 repeat protein
VAISPDNHWLVTGSSDKTARLWDLTAKDPSANPVVLRGHENDVSAVAISPDNHWVVTGSSDKTARLWLFQVKDLIDFARAKAGRNLTADEWKQYFRTSPTTRRFLICQVRSVKRSKPSGVRAILASYLSPDMPSLAMMTVAALNAGEEESQFLPFRALLFRAFSFQRLNHTRKELASSNFRPS